MGGTQGNGSIAKEPTKSGDLSIASTENGTQDEVGEVGDLQSRPSSARLDTAEIARVLTPGSINPGMSHRARKGPPSVVHSMAAPSISETGEGEDPSSVCSPFSNVSENNLSTYSQMARYLARRATLLGWFDEARSDNGLQHWSSTCVAVRTFADEYSFFPYNVNPTLSDAIVRLGETSAIAMSSTFTSALIDSIAPGQKSLIMDSTSARIPIVSCLNDVNPDLVHFARACIVVQERIILVWSHDAGAILNVAFDVERQLGKTVSPFTALPISLHLADNTFSTRQGPRISNLTSPRVSGRSSPFDLDTDALASTPSNSMIVPVRGALDEKHEVYSKAVALENGEEEDDPVVDLEGNMAPRPTHRIHAFKISFAIMLVILTQSLGVARVSSNIPCMTLLREPTLTFSFLVDQ
jgi:hypothetical protein